MELLVENISLYFSGLTVLDQLSFNLTEPGVYAVIGPNGAGKTSLINSILGFYRPQKGSIFVGGLRVNRLPPHEIAKLGMARVFQNTALFSNLTVLDNVLLGKHISLDYGLLAASWHYGKARKSEIQQRKKVEEIIDSLEMGVIRKELVGNLSFGLKKKVELARALAMDPKILFLDEPASGMNQEEKEDIVRFVLSIRRSRDIPIVIVEHDMNVVMNISDRVTVMSHGQKIAEGTSQSVQENPSVIEAYLGEKRV